MIGIAMADDKAGIGEDTDKHYGIGYNKQVWDLLAKNERTPEDDDLIIHSAHASHIHWLAAGTALHKQRGLWMLSHVYAELGLGERALHYAKETESIAQDYANLMRDFDHCYTSEALARAYAISGGHDNANLHYFEAYAAGKKIADDEDREIFMSDLQGGNWGDFDIKEQS